MHSLQAIGDRVSVEVQWPQAQTGGGIHIPDTCLGNERVSGTIMSVGADVTSVSAGDRIVLDQFSGTLIEHDGQQVLLLRERDILGLLEEE